ncbi:hypothetical protein [Virgibacillus sp. DJP39]|uniref:hypothetical protein n=1 Tax=Virgibacillus sp. DJP39 TaxID=3409790 RepID=UPI003BB71504
MLVFWNKKGTKLKDTLPFLLLAVGQVLGSLLAEVLIESCGYVTSFILDKA